MGLSASQGRMLSLTARLSDLEFRALSIQNQKIRLADQSEAASKNYLDALAAKKLTAYNSETNTHIDATLSSLYNLNKSSQNGTKRVIVDASGRVVVPGSYLTADGTALKNGKSINADHITTTTQTIYDEERQEYITKEVKENDPYRASGYTACPNGMENNVEYLYKQLSCGNWYLVEYDEEGGADGAGAWEKVSWSSGDAQLVTKDDDYILAVAEAEYETAMNEIQGKDKRFDLELQAIDSEHSAVQTEMDSVTKVMNKNIERTFKIFG